MKAQFTSKVAELALQGEGPPEVLNRAKLLARLYEDLLPSNFADRVDALRRSSDWRVSLRALLVRQPSEDYNEAEVVVDPFALGPVTVVKKIRPRPRKTRRPAS
jgi:hypothetical protein